MTFYARRFHDFICDTVKPSDIRRIAEPVGKKIDAQIRRRHFTKPVLLALLKVYPHKDLTAEDMAVGEYKTERKAMKDRAKARKRAGCAPLEKPETPTVTPLLRQIVARVKAERAAKAAGGMVAPAVVPVVPVAQPIQHAQQQPVAPSPTVPASLTVATIQESMPPTAPMSPFTNEADPLPDGVKLMILMPGRNISLQAFYCVNQLVRIGEGKVILGEPETLYDAFTARNRMADRFLQSDATWSLWLDPDNILPCEQPQWWLRNVPAARRWTEPLFSSMNAINRLASHHLTDKTKKIVGSVYFDRFGRGVPMYANARENPDQRAMLNGRGPRDALVSAGRYTGTGALLVHRAVYEDIMRTQPEWAVDREKYPWEGHAYGFFDKLDHFGDDVSFGVRCIRAGHQPFVDLAVCAAHVGDMCYANERINAD